MTASTATKRRLNPSSWMEQYGFADAIEVTGATRTIVCSGQAAVNAHGVPVCAGDMAAQIERTFDNIEAVLADAGCTLADVVRLNIFTTDMDTLFGHLGRIARRLEPHSCKPASTIVEVARLGFPEMLVEIEATAIT